MRRSVSLSAATVAAIAVAAPSAQPQAVQLQVIPTRLGPAQQALLVVAIPRDRAGEVVTIQSKECRMSTFRNVAAAETDASGRWQLEYSAFVNTVLRAKWRDAFSAPVEVRQAPAVHFDEVSRGRFEVGVGSRGDLWRKRVDVQRRVGSRWVALKSVVVTKTYSSPGRAGTYVQAHFRAKLPPGTALRALLTAKQARPCYLGGTSSVIRTQG